MYIACYYIPDFVISSFIWWLLQTWNFAAFIFHKICAQAPYSFKQKICLDLGSQILVLLSRSFPEAAPFIVINACLRCPLVKLAVKRVVSVGCLRGPKNTRARKMQLRKLCSENVMGGVTCLAIPNKERGKEQKSATKIKMPRHGTSDAKKTQKIDGRKVSSCPKSEKYGSAKYVVSPGEKIWHSTELDLHWSLDKKGKGKVKSSKHH